MSSDVNLTKQQLDVVNVKNRDVLVSASAGSGKTFVVAKRIINRVVKDKVDIDKMLVVTFTNAAASELKARILNGLYNELKDKSLDEDTKKHIVRQLSLINRAQISTIHSFCLSIIKNHFYLLEIDPNVKTIDENRAKLMILETISEILQQEYENGSLLFEQILELFKGEENIIQQVEKIYNFSQSMTYPDKWLNESLARYSNKSQINDLSETDFGKQIITSVKEKLRLLMIELEKVCNKICNDKDFESRLKVLETMLEKLNESQVISTFDELYAYVRNINDFPRLPSSKCVKEALKKEVSDIKKKVTNEINELSKIIYKDTKNIIHELNESYDIVNWFVSCVFKLNEMYMEKKKNLGYIDFSDYEHLALKVLENEDICNQYKDKFEDIYIDEYQDTSYVQEVILKKISKNNKIMVGDVKQSIYSFRNAEPSLFNEKYRDFDIYSSANENDDNPVKIILSKNFRSRKCVLDSINDVFKNIMSEQVGECNYTEQEYLVYGDGFDDLTESACKTEINIVETDNESDKEEEETLLDEEISEISNVQKEAMAISNKINQIILDKFKIYDNKEKEYKEVQYKDIVILLRATNNKANIYEQVLKSQKIPVYSDTSDSFYNGQEISIILSLLKVIDNFYDDISLVSTMYSIIGGFTVDDLVYIRNYNKNDYMYNCVLMAYQDVKNSSTEIYIKIEKFLNLLDNISKYLATYTIADTILKIYNETGIYYSFYLEELGRQKCANLDSLVEIARAFEIEQKSSTYEFINYIENIKNKKTKGNDTPKLLGEGENVVRILTVHKSKGLEYPIVFLADSNKKYNIMDLTSEILLDKKYGIGIDTFNTNLGISYSNIIKQAIKENIKAKTLSEEERLLYVAMTRAKEKLYVYGTVKDYDKFMDKLLVPANDKPSYVVVKDCNSYLKLIMLALNNSSSPNYEVNRINMSHIKGNDLKVENGNVSRDISYMEKFLKRCEEQIIGKIDIDISFADEYKYIDSLDIKKKYTVTEIKNMTADKSQDETYMFEEDAGLLEQQCPSCINKEISNLNYGTIIHKILEYVDYLNLDKLKLQERIDDICKESPNINSESIKKKIFMYLDGPIRNIVNNAKHIYKEKPFVIYDDLKDIEGLELKEKTYIQGVIDLYVHTKEDTGIIIDFKTDKVNTEKELIDKYKNQLLVYKRGIELSINTKVKHMYIYSFSLNELIEIFD